jgi:hypothetical protein
MHHAAANCEQGLSLKEVCIAKLASNIDQSEVIHVPALSMTVSSFTVRLPAYHPSLSKHTPLKEQCTIALHFSLPANAYLRRCRRRRLDRESISSPAPTAVIRFLLSPAAATRSGVAFASFTSSPPSPFVLLASNHLPDHALPTPPNQLPLATH